MRYWLLCGALIAALGLLLARRSGRCSPQATLAGVLVVALCLLLAWTSGSPSGAPVSPKSGLSQPGSLNRDGKGSDADKSSERGSAEATPGTGAAPTFAEVPQIVRADGYQTSQACRECHAEQYSTWHDTFHRTMTQLPSPDTVIAPLDQPVRLDGRGRTCVIEKRGNEYWVRMADPDWEVPLAVQGVNLEEAQEVPYVERRIVMTTGSHHLQAYWVATADGLRQVPWEYHRQDQRWMPLEDVFLRPPDAGRMFGHWNSSCIQCHSVNPVPGYQPVVGGFKSRVAELGIACEACHGPGEAHIRHHRESPATSAAVPDRTILNPARCAPEVSARICGQCHATFEPLDRERFLTLGHRHQAGEDLGNSRQLVRFDHPLRQQMAEAGTAIYWGDRACRVGGAEYLGLLESKCFQSGQLSCVSCHTLHGSDPNHQLGTEMEGNQACLQCHESYRDRLAEHTHHAPESAGSLCYNCHMPHTTYALLGALRTHRIDSPSVESSVRHGRPNACNLCHVDRTLNWAADKLTEWYGAPKVNVPPEETQVAASLVWLLRGDAMQRALAAWHLGWSEAQSASGSQWQSRLLTQVFDDPYPAVRYVAHAAILGLPNPPAVPFDFVGSKTSRDRARQQILDAVSQPISEKVDLEKILLAPNGQVHAERVKQLQSRRDDRPVNIPE